MTGILVFVESKDGRPRKCSLEAIGAAREVSEEVVALIYGHGASAIAPALAGAARATCFEVSDSQGYSPEGALAAVEQLAGQIQPEAIFFSASSLGRDLAPRVAARLNCAQASDCTELRREEGQLHLRRPLFAGKAYAWVRSRGATIVATLRANVFPAAEGGSAPQVETADPPAAELRSIVKEVLASAAGALDVAEAPIVVSGGRGMKDPENWKLLEELAAAFGGRATCGASRAVVDAGWRPHSEQVGQTGKTVAPQLYIAAGISGAIQHLAGMRTSKVIVAINKDPEAPIFKVADYGIVGDCLEVLPALSAAIAQALA